MHGSGCLESKGKMNRILTLVTVFLVCAVGLTVDAADETQGGFTQHILDVKSRVYDVAVSPDGRRITTLVGVSAWGKDPSEKKFNEELQVWDWESATLSSHRVLHEGTFVHAADYSASGRFVRYSDAGTKLIVCQGDGHLLVMDSKTLEIIQDMDMEKLKWTTQFRASNTNSFVRDMEVDSQARRAAVLLAWGLSGKGELRVYDLSSGRLLQTWPIQDSMPHNFSRPISIDPKGTQVALSLKPFEPGERKLRREERNVLIYDIDSGKLVTSANTGYLAGTIHLSTSDTMVTVSGDATRNNRDPLRIWDLHTGKLLREIANPQEGIHYVMDVSADGRIAVASIALQESKSAFLWLEAVTIHKKDRLRLWDLTTGKILATTPYLPGQSAKAVQLSPDGNLVASYSADSGSILLFEVK